MTIVQANESMTSVLSQVKDLAEIRDSSGTILGLFVPGTAEEARLYIHAWLTLDPEQVRLRKQSAEKTFTTEEVLTHVRSLGDR